VGASGTTTVDFGAFPGKSDTSVAVSQPSILGGSLVEAWLYPVATADHSADEHLVETIRVIAGNVSAGVGFTIYAMNTSQLNEPLALANAAGGFRSAATTVSGTSGPSVGGIGTRIYGQFTVSWVWN
jgi:hypothetical protein